MGAWLATVTPRVSKWSPGASKSDVWGTPGASKKSTVLVCFSVLDLVLVRRGGGVARRALGYIYIYMTVVRNSVH